MTKRAMATAARAMAMRVAGKQRQQEQWQRRREQQSTSNGINKGGRRLVRECRQGDHMTTMVGDNKGRERAAYDDGCNEEGKGGKGDSDGNEGDG